MKRRERWWLRLHPLAARIDRRVPVEWVVKRATVSNENRYCYFRIPKCANSTVIKTLAHHDRVLARAAENASPEALKQASGSLFRARALSPASLARRYFCFTIVRDPYTRLLSAYLDKIAAAGPGHYGYVTAATGRRDVTNVTFEDFVGFLEGGGLFANAHWAPQSALLPIDPAALAFVGRVETLDDDLARLLQQLPIDTGYAGTRSREDRRRHSDTRLDEYYTAGLRRRVARLYADDFRAFDYASEPAGTGAAS